MPKLSENFAPYTSIGNMLVLLGRIRKGWTPSSIDGGEMARAGITSGNANRTITTLQFLGLIDEDNNTTSTWKAIATSTTNDYPKVLEGVLRNAYSFIFEIHPNPAEATDVDIANAFAKSEPLNQRTRMVSLFRGLCQEAGLIAGDPLTRDRKTNTKQSGSKNTKNNSSEDFNPKIQKTFIAPPVVDSSLRWYNDLQTLMGRLPNPDNPRWTKTERDRWLTALQSMLDLLIKIDNKEE